MRLGILGWPMVGKTTVFNALTRSSARTGAFGGGTAGPNLAVVRVPDPRVDALSGLYSPKKTTYATVEYVDMAGFERGKGKESEAFLNHARKVDALVHVVRAFDDESVPHVEGSVDPSRDLRLMEEELIIADLIAIERRCDRLDSESKRGKKAEAPVEAEALARARTALENVQPLRTVVFTPAEEVALRGFAFLSQKPLLLVQNLGEAQLANAPALSTTIPLLNVCGKLEEELTQLSEEDCTALMAAYGIVESSLLRMIQASYDLLGLMSFYTTGEDEVRAWTVHKQSQALEAARTIHSDIARGFIRAEVIKFEDLVAFGNFAKAREAGRLRLEGKDYVLEDGEVVHFRFAL